MPKIEKQTMANIPVFQTRDTGFVPQLYRVRATCLSGGEMLTGQSDFFALTPDESAFVAQVLPSELDPIPAAIEVEAPAERIFQGSTLQMDVTAVLPDGGREDVTPRAAGTTYLSTNASLATVSVDGLVTGTNVGGRANTTVAILVAHEGHLAVIQLTSSSNLDTDFDGDGLPNEYEDLFGLDKEFDDSRFDPDSDFLTNAEEFELGTLPNQDDTDLDGLVDGADPDPLVPDETPPIISVLSPPDGATLIEGETVRLSSAAVDDGQVVGIDAFVNGVELVPFGDPPLACDVPFTVPFDATALVFSAAAVDTNGNLATAESFVTVAEDPGTTVVGRVVDSAGQGLPNATVRLRLGGLRAELFDFDQPLGSFPDLSGSTPQAIRYLSAANLLNPDHLFSPDTFGAGLAPDFAVRLSGLLELSHGGDHDFYLEADDGARLRLDGVSVLEVLGDGELTEGRVTLGLDAGPLPIEIEYFQGVGDAELRFSMAEPFAERRLVESGDLAPFPVADFDAVTDTEGFYEIPGVPTILGDLRVEAVVVDGGQEIRGLSDATAPVRGATTEVGDVVLAGSRVLLFDQQCGDSLSFLPTALENLGVDFSGASTDAELAERLAAEPWDVVLIDANSERLVESTPRIREFIESGGRVFLSYWDLGRADSLALSFEAERPVATSSTSLVFLWDPSVALLSDPNEIDSVISYRFGSCTPFGATYETVGGGVALGGTRSTPSTRAVLSTGNSGRTVLLGILLGLFQADGDFDGRPDGLEIAENVVRFLTRP